jgi:similar to stage IV sporulation protein
MPIWSTQLLWSKTVLLPIRIVPSVLNCARDNNVKIKTYRAADDKTKLCVSCGGWQLLCRELPALQELEDVQKSGLLPFLAQRKARAGLLVGALLSVLIGSFLGGRVWDVRVSGNTLLSDAQIVQELEKAGLGVGTPLTGLDTKAVARDVQLSSDRLAFVGINLRGTVAYVHVMESDVREEAQSYAGGNLIAAFDAVIEDLAVRHGSVAVKRGQVVKKGDLLVSGITEGSGGNRLVCAEGEVMGRVQRRIEIVLPRKSCAQTKANRQNIGFDIIFFGKRINICANTGNLPPTYDTIYKIEQLYVGDRVRLPIGIGRTVAVSYIDEEVTLSDQELVSLACRRLEAELALALRQGELVSKKTYGSFTEDAYVLVCEIECLEDIARLVEFEAA